MCLREVIKKTFLRVSTTKSLYYGLLALLYVCIKGVSLGGVG